MKVSNDLKETFNKFHFKRETLPSKTTDGKVTESTNNRINLKDKKERG